MDLYGKSCQILSQPGLWVQIRSKLAFDLISVPNCWIRFLDNHLCKCKNICFNWLQIKHSCTWIPCVYWMCALCIVQYHFKKENEYYFKLCITFWDFASTIQYIVVVILIERSDLVSLSSLNAFAPQCVCVLACRMQVDKVNGKMHTYCFFTLCVCVCFR